MKDDSKVFKSLKEAFENYDHSIEKALAKITGLEDSKAKALASKMTFEDYLEFAMAIHNNENEHAEEIVSKYLMKRDDNVSSDNFEAIAQEMKYLIRNGEDNVIIPEFKMAGEFGQRAALNEMDISQLQKILANSRGYTTPGIYESSLLHVQLVEEIIQRVKNMKISQIIETSTMAPGEQQRAKAYGAKNASSQEKKTAKFQNDDGETEEGEVVSDAGPDQVNVRTKRGIKKMKKDDLLMNETPIVKMSELRRKKK